MPNDPPFDPSNTWWPSPAWPRSGPPGGPTNPSYWTDPFINPSAVAPTTPAPFSAAQLGAMAWHPPIFPGDWMSFPPSTFPALGVSPPMPPVASPWPNRPLSFPPPARLTSPDTPSEDRPSPFVSQSSIDNIGGLFSRDPSMPYGLFPYPFDTSPSSTSRFGSGPSSAGGLDASAATPATPGLFPAPGWPPVESFLPPFPPLPNPFAVDTPAPDSSSGPASGPTGGATPPAAPPRSVLFNQPQPSWDFDAALIARQRAAAALDAGADEIGAGELPRSKSGAPYAPPSFSPALPLSFEPPGWRDIAHLLSPNIVDYFTKTLPPAPPFPATPGKIPSTDNPYAGGAALEAAAFLLALLEGRIGASLASAASKLEIHAAEAALRRAKSLIGSKVLAPSAGRLAAGASDELGGTLPPDALNRIVSALRAAVASGNLTKEEANALLRRTGSGVQSGETEPATISAWLPKYDRKRTNGLLITNEGDVVPFQAGRPRKFWNYPSAKHVEGKAAVWIRENDSSGGVVFHNNMGGTCGFCNIQLKRLLPHNGELDVVPPPGAVAEKVNAVAEPTWYVGDAEMPKLPRQAD
jgi:hypothetical protein